MKNNFEKIITFSPAFDKRNPNPSINYGVGAVICNMILKGKGLAIHFSFSTGIYPENVEQEWKVIGTYVSGALAYYIGYHDTKKHYKGQMIESKNCLYLNNKPCYYDTSYSEADEFLKILRKEGCVGVWKKMEEKYITIKEEQKCESRKK